MRHWILILMLSCVGLAFAQEAADYRVIPLPESIVAQQGAPFVLDESVRILAGDELAQEAAFLKDYLVEVAGLNLTIDSRKEKKVRYISLTVSPEQVVAEGYVLIVNKDGIQIKGGSAAGVFYAIQMLRKSIFQSRTLSPVIIKDSPRFQWRGMHLDCSRHFFPLSFVKKYIDLLALHQMNVFHWHITDDQGWRIEIKKWPRLISFGSHRTGTIVGMNSDIDDEQPYGGYYTQEEAREIVAYAKARHITVIPEIDMPGHMLAALASYPELGCTGGPYQVGHYWGVYKDVLCVGNEKVYQFVEDVLSEIMDIFPSEVIHIGGDETPTERWEHCVKCQAVDLAGNTLQGYFTQRVFNFLQTHHRRALGWDELLENHAPQNTMIMSWRGTEPGAEAAEKGHDVVMAPLTHCYFNFQQVEDVRFEPSRCDGFIPIEKVYSLDPAPDSLSVEAKKHILGVQANLWAEYLTQESLAEYQALPRLTAIAEVQWTQPSHKDYKDFVDRLTRMTQLYDKYNYHYCKHLWPERQMPSRWEF